MTFETTDPQGAKGRLDGDQDWTCLDVRTVQEFEAGHVPGAYNVPLLEMTASGMQPNQDFLSVVQRAFTQETALILCCKVGVRSHHACEILAGAGFGTTVNMDGGVDGRRDAMGQTVQEGWKGSGFECSETPEPGRTYRELRGDS
jgi:rhodanese-related sulfurtransferase